MEKEHTAFYSRVTTESQTEITDVEAQAAEVPSVLRGKRAGGRRPLQRPGTDQTKFQRIKADANGKDTSPVAA